mmetsp:Transcript_45831/g.111765  ORF Transcript_45831/g.111765 Transcript_45831/m.111765 type:complete len:298 (-) Transcript_45831:160-1053(-)
MQNSRTRRRPLRGAISFRKPSPIWAAAKGIFCAFKSSRRRKFTKRPWAVSGRRYPTDVPSGPIDVLNIKLNGNDLLYGCPVGDLQSYFVRYSSSSPGLNASACRWIRKCASFSSVLNVGFCSKSSSIASSNKWSARRHSPVSASLTMRSVNRSTCPLVLKTASGVRHVHSISNIFSVRTKCFRHKSIIAALRPHAGGPRSNRPFTPPWIAKDGTTNILRIIKSSNDLRLNCGVDESICVDLSAATNFNACKALTASSMSFASAPSFFIWRTAEPCFVIFAFNSSNSSWILANSSSEG